MPETATKIMSFLKVRLGILEERYTQHRAKKKLRLRETLSLGDKRFLAVVEYQSPGNTGRGYGQLDHGFDDRLSVGGRGSGGRRPY